MITLRSLLTLSSPKLPLPSAKELPVFTVATSPKLLALLTCLAAPAVALVSCGPASYQVLEPAKTASGPQTLGPTPQPPAPPPAPAPVTVEPTGRVVVMFNSQSVTTVNVSTATTIQPSWDTFSPSYEASTPGCVNPGIVRADYVITDPNGKTTPASATRATGTCQTLGVPFTFTIAGNYLIAMTVTDPANQTAKASMTLTALAAGTTDGGFNITAVPILTKPNSGIDFTGFCFMAPGFTITWNFGDNSPTATGITQVHQYGLDNQYLVTATCTSADSKTTKTASVSVVITDQTITLPPSTNDTPVGPPQTPTQNPIQTPVQQVNQSPVQQVNQSPVQAPH